MGPLGINFIRVLVGPLVGAPVSLPPSSSYLSLESDLLQLPLLLVKNEGKRQVWRSLKKEVGGGRAFLLLLPIFHFLPNFPKSVCWTGSKEWEEFLLKGLLPRIESASRQDFLDHCQKIRKFVGF